MATAHPERFADYRDRHRGETIIVCGCGRSLALLEQPKRFVTIGVNDIGRRFTPDYLVVVNEPRQFDRERYTHVERSQARAVFTQLDLPLKQVVRFRLGQRGGTERTDPECLHYTNNSPYVALNLARHFGARRVGLIGVDFTDDHFFARTGTHPLAQQLTKIDDEYKKLGAACERMGIEVYNLSPISRLTAFLRMTLEEFSSLARGDAVPTSEAAGLRAGLADFLSHADTAPGAQRVASMPSRRKLFIVNYHFLSCGDVFSHGLRHAASDLALAYEDAYWDDVQLPDKIERFAPELILVVHGRRFAQKWADRFRAYNTAVWLTDEPYEVDDTARWSHQFKTVFVNDPNTIHRHRNAHYLPVCFDMRTHRDCGRERTHRVGFIGGYNAIREPYLLQLAEAGLLDYIVGGPWHAPALRKRCLASNIPAERTAELYQQTEIVINVFRAMHHFNRQGIAASSMNPRIYEGLACGAAVVSERRAEIGDVFPELPQFETADELLSIVGGLLADKERLARTRAECQRRLAGHSYSNRLKQALQLTVGGVTHDSVPDGNKMIHITTNRPGKSVVKGWERYGEIDCRADGCVMILEKPYNGASGTETGLVSDRAYTDVELSFDVRLGPDAWFLAKIHQQDRYEQTTNSYHLVLSSHHDYVAKHFHIFHQLRVKRGAWQRIKLRFVDQWLEVVADGVPQARQSDNQLLGGYCFLGVKGGRVELRDIQLLDLTVPGERQDEAPHPGVSVVAHARSAVAIPDQAASDLSNRPGALPVGTPPRRNLMYHIWPVRGSTWKWNLDELKKRIDLFNGRRVVGVVHDNRSESPEAVRDYLEGHGCEFVVVANDERGEAATFPLMLAKLASGNPDELTFYAHAKGVKYEPEFPENVRRWTDTQYRVSLDNWPAVKQQMQRFPMTGPFRIVGRFRAHRYASDWHYSGTFFWMRNGAIFSNRYRDVPQFYGGVEAWPGVMFKQRETGCLLMDNLRQLPYHDLFWRDGANQAVRAWESNVCRVPPPPDLLGPAAFEGHRWPRLEQKPEEFAWWIRILLAHNVEHLLTIGSMCGGAEWHIARTFSEQGRKIFITAVDIQERKELQESFQDVRTRFGQCVKLVVGNSNSAKVRDQLTGKYDAVFIDGDHGYSACRKDFLLAKSQAPRLVGFHDIVDSDWHAEARCCVSRLWEELVHEYETEEIASGEWGGIGVVKL